MSIKNYILTGLLLMSGILCSSAQTPQEDLLEKLNYYLGGYVDPDVKVEKIAVDSIKIDDNTKKLDVFVNLRLAYIPLRTENVQQFYHDFNQLIPQELKNYKLTILSGERAVEQLSRNFYSKSKDKNRLFGSLE